VAFAVLAFRASSTIGAAASRLAERVFDRMATAEERRADLEGRPRDPHF
jgi:hypothetical protein